VNVDVAANASLPYNSIVYDPGGDFNTSNYSYTAPVHGLYYIYFNAYRNSSTGALVSVYVNSNTEVLKCRPVPQGGDFVFHSAGLIRLEKGDYVTVRALNLIDNFYGSTDQRYSSFGGWLVD